MSKQEVTVTMTVKRDVEGVAQLCKVEGVFQFTKQSGNWYIDGTPVLSGVPDALTRDENGELRQLAYEAREAKFGV